MALQNNGQQGWKVIREKFADTGVLTGRIMPNISQISPEAIIDNTSAITYNYPTDVAPTGGANGDVWYNPVADQLYKKTAGTWTLLTDRVTNDNFVAPITNLTDCPLP